MNNRRKLVIALGASAITAPFGSFAQQQGKVWRIGFLNFRGRPTSLDSDFLNGAFLRGMRELGYVEGKTLVIEWRFADSRPERLPGLAADLVQLGVDVIVAGNTTAALAAQKATTTIPIVMANPSDPVGSGLVKSLARPGGNITGISNMASELGPKLLEILLSVVPKLSRLAILVNPVNPSHAAMLKDIQGAAARAGIKVIPIETRTPEEIEKAFSLMKQDNTRAFIVASDALFIQQRQKIAELAAINKMPSIWTLRDYAEVGGLMSYGPDYSEHFRRAATYVDKILKGAKPADLPIEQPTTFEFAINIKTAKALGIKFPNAILVRANRVIE